MSRLNLSENLFIGTQELNMLQQFNNFTKVLGLMTKTYGFLENKDLNSLMKLSSNSERGCFKASTPGALQLQFTTPSYAFAYSEDGGKVITWDKNRTIILDDTFKGKSWWVKISYTEDFIEKGTLKIDKNGNVTGTGTSFTTKLRGEPNFPSVIKLYTYSLNNFEEKGTYYVDTVIGDESMILYSPTGIGDISLNYYYAICGTFPQGSNVFEEDLFPYRYDGCKVEFVEDNTAGGDIPNEYVMKNSNSEFYVARITVDLNSGELTEIEDKRFIFESLNTADSKYTPEENNRYSKWFSLK